MHRNHKLEKNLLREYVKTVLSEDDEGFVSSTDGGSPYGTSWGSGDDLVKTFVTPFLDVFKTAAGKSKEIGQRVKTLLFVTLKAVLTTLIPAYGYNYTEVFDKEKEKIDKIRGEYQDVYERTNKILGNNDAAMLAFMASPALVIGSWSAKMGPGALKGILSAASGGISDDIYNGMKRSAIAAGRWSLGTDDASDDYVRPSKKSKKSPKDFYGESRILEQEASAKKSVITPEKIIRSSVFLEKTSESSMFKEMQKVAITTYRETLKQIYKQAEDVLSKANTIEDLESLSKKPVKDIDKIKSLKGEEKAKAEKFLIDSVRKSMKDFYIKNLTEQVNSVVRAGIPENSQYIKDFRATIQKIKLL